MSHVRTTVSARSARGVTTASPGEPHPVSTAPGLPRPGVDGAADHAGRRQQVDIDALPEPFLAIDMATRCFVLANDAAQRLLGYSEAELQAMTPADVLSVADGSRLELAFQTVSPGTVSRREWMLQTSSGRTRPVGVTSIPVQSGGRQVIYLLVHDLSDEDSASAQRTLLAMANDRLTMSLGYAETLRAIVALLVPRIADACTVELFDANQRPFKAARGVATSSAVEGVAVEIVPDGHNASGRAADSPDLPLPASVIAPSAEVLTLMLRAHGRETGSLTLERRTPRAWTPEGRALALAMARRAAQAIDSALLWQTAQRELARRAAFLRVSRAFAESEPGSGRPLEVLLIEASAMLDADHGGISLWDASSRMLIQVYSSNGPSSGITLPLENSLSGRAALERRPVIANEYQRSYGANTPAGRAGAEAGIAAPLLHEGRLIGTISVGTLRTDRRFGDEDGEALELLAGIAASMLGTLERARLQAVSLASRELAHRLNNDLALAVGTIDLLREDPTVSTDLQTLVEDAAVGLQRVSEHLQRLQQITRFQVHDTPVGPALDLDRSTAAGTESV